MAAEQKNEQSKKSNKTGKFRNVQEMKTRTAGINVKSAMKQTTTGSKRTKQVSKMDEQDSTA